MNKKTQEIAQKLEDFNFWEGTDDAVRQLHKILKEMFEVMKENEELKGRVK